MIDQEKTKQVISFTVRFILPTLVTIALFLTAFFSIIIPTIEKNSLDRKREMIRELTTSAWNIFAKLDHDAQMGIVTKEQAQKQAIEQIKSLHYGREMKDYFWINDMHPRMVIHPYRSDLNGKDLSDYKDPHGKKIFQEMVQVVEKAGDGYVEYMWQWKDEQGRILPKISYVKGFAPWGWIIGTGIYVDDVKMELASITRDLIKITLVILLIITLILAYIANQSYRALKEKQRALKALRESEEKYRTLVESAAEGMFMALEGSLMYVNQTIADMLGFSKEALSGMKVEDIFVSRDEADDDEYIHALIDGKSVPERFETRLRTKSGKILDVALSATGISLGGEIGYMAVVSDITKRKKAEHELGESEEKFRTMANNLNVGFFRMTTGRNPRFIEANPALVELFGYDSKENLLSTPIINLYHNREEYKNLAPKADESGLRREVVKFRKKDGTLFYASIWGVRISAEDKTQYFDGILEDITEVVQREEESRNLISEMQSTLMFFNQHLENLNVCKVNTCLPGQSVHDAAVVMERENTDVLLVKDEAGRNLGVLTHHDLRKALIQEGRPSDIPVADVMSDGVIAMPGQSSVFEAWHTMTTTAISHLFITNHSGMITGVLDGDDVLAIQNYSPTVLLCRIRNARAPEEIFALKTARPYLLTTLIESGAKPQNINHLTTLVSDTILEKFIEFAMSELGPPPVPFSFIVFGSEGREEQTLHTDQDNAIIYEDVPPEQDEKVRRYFLSMGEKVCTWLNDAGYTFCYGNNMAMNPEYCQPLSAWKQYFSRWVYTASAEDLLRTKIFFDFRCAYGEESFEDVLRDHLNHIVADNSRFFQLLARNILPMAPPIGLFGNFIVESSGANRGSFDIKSSMMPIVDFARIYALKNRIRASNTIRRLNALREQKVLTDQNHQEMVQAYSYLMQIRLRIQAEAVSSRNDNPNNYIFPKTLTSIEQKLLKEIFAQTKNFQVRLSYDFTGQVGNL
jgi:PAS domain S-box-containing protein